MAESQVIYHLAFDLCGPREAMGVRSRAAREQVKRSVYGACGVGKAARPVCIKASKGQEKTATEVEKVAIGRKSEAAFFKSHGHQLQTSAAACLVSQDNLVASERRRAAGYGDSCWVSLQPPVGDFGTCRHLPLWVGDVHRNVIVKTVAPPDGHFYLWLRDQYQFSVGGKLIVVKRSWSNR
jgi:hypothetical protein